MIKNLYNIIYKILYLTNKKNKIFLVLISFFIILTSLFEILSLTSFYYFLNFYANQKDKIPEIIFDMLDNIFFLNYLIIFFLFFILFFFLRIVFSITATYLLHNLGYKFNVEMSDFLSLSYLEADYKKMFNQKDSSLISNLTDKIPHVSTIFNNINFLFAELMILAVTLLFLSIVNFQLTLFLLLFFLSVLVFYNRFFQNKIAHIAKNRQHTNNKRLELATFIIKSLKDIKILQKEQYVHGLLKKFSEKNFSAHKKMQIIQTYPRFVSEFFFLFLIIFFFIYFFLIKKDNINIYIPLIGSYIFAIFRIIPIINKITFYINNSLFYKPALDIFYNEKNYFFSKKIKLTSEKKISFNNKLNIKNISYSYNQKDYIFKNLNINFLKNKSYAILAPSGFGKTTLLNIILGLLKPINGSVKIDNNNISTCLKEYLSLIGYIPQEFFFLEDTVKKTIVFGKEKNRNKIFDIVKKLNLINSTNKIKINQFLNKNIKLLSVGQKQKIAIARCLYNENSILIFDEPTSALDKESINGLIKIIKLLKRKKTIIVVTHDLNFAKNFDYQIDLSKLK